MTKDRFKREVPEGDTHERLVCNDCGFINYVNPRVIVGAICTWEDRILMCKRAINPRAGYWTLPAGFMELHETPMEGAARETAEEANADVALDALLGVYTIERVGQVQLFYRGRLRSPAISPGIESLEVALYTWDEIPWDDIAFSSVHWALHHFREIGQEGAFQPFSNPDGLTD